ncbi:TetR family transcriptional regulator [Murinocardiopsis flavida]|uniref:TetR family transcriptional regulator n=1 Tax=Murinocardiopsis flavida TaxID=645275 RepID=A0A2P8D2F8_9ACTN|nr:TetR/AcrR family transcriptional regulator [Murinocardiopsis flavida]PSK91397.1 TetR family transcriptional regulator [Murinocardiopsis flavida]
MSTQDGASTQDRILATARELFAAHTYRAATMRQIAERLGITKPSLYYHFGSKAEILETLLSEPVRELDTAVSAAAEEPDQDEARRRVLRGCIDVIVRHRDVMRLLFRDASVYGDESVHIVGRLVGTVDRAVEVLAGPDPDWRSRLRAAQAFAAATDPVNQFPDVGMDELRAELFAGASAVLARHDPSRT